MIVIKRGLIDVSRGITVNQLLLVEYRETDFLALQRCSGNLVFSIINLKRHFQFHLTYGGPRRRKCRTKCVRKYYIEPSRLS